MNKVSFEEIGAVAATFFAQKEVKAGQVVKMTATARVGPARPGTSSAAWPCPMRTGAPAYR